MTTTTTAHPAEVLLDAQAAGALHLPVCDHYSGVEERMRKSLQLQAQMLQEFGTCVFDVTLDCEDGASVGQEQAHAQLVAQLDERFLEQLEVGQRATVIADAFPNQRLQARVLSMAPGVDAQRGSIEVKLALQAAPPTFLREDMTLSVEIETGRRPQALALPLSALRHIDGDTATVYIAQDGRAQAQSVRLGLRNLVAAEVTQGLAADALVLLGPRVQPGMRVRPQAQPWHADSTSSPTRAGGRDSDAGAALTQAVGR